MAALVAARHLNTPTHRRIQGFVCAAVGSILAEHENLRARIRLCFGVDQETFARDASALIEAYAGYVHLLPRHPTTTFVSPAACCN